MKAKQDGAALLVKVLDRGQAAAGAGFGADDADAFEDGHFGGGVPGGRRSAIEDFDVGVVG